MKAKIHRNLWTVNSGRLIDLVIQSWAREGAEAVFDSWPLFRRDWIPMDLVSISPFERACLILCKMPRLLELPMADNVRWWLTHLQPGR